MTWRCRDGIFWIKNLKKLKIGKPRLRVEVFDHLVLEADVEI